MDDRHRRCDVLIVGSGPAGLAAAAAAAESGAYIILADDNPGLGGQIWRGEQRAAKSSAAARWLTKVQHPRIEFQNGALVCAQSTPGELLAETSTGVVELEYRKLIVANGARERFLPFPGWTLPNVMGAGGLQALVKSGLPIDGRSVVVAGSGPLLPAVAAYLRRQGARVLLIAEQSPASRIFKFASTLWRHPKKVFQGISLRTQLLGVPFHTGCWPVAALGRDKLESVRLRQGDRTRDVQCDYLACGFHLIPNLELAALLGCEINETGVRIDDFQETTVANIYCAGETTGIGGLDLSLVEGRIAGYAATGQKDKAARLWSRKRRHQRFASSMNNAFALRHELKELAEPSTIVCRCEDVTFERIKQFTTWREAKLQSRCGMGPCQGRICGAEMAFLMGWKAESARPPVFPVRVQTLAMTARQRGNPS